MDPISLLVDSRESRFPNSNHQSHSYQIIQFLKVSNITF